MSRSPIITKLRRIAPDIAVRKTKDHYSQDPMTYVTAAVVVRGFLVEELSAMRDRVTAQSVYEAILPLADRIPDAHPAKKQAEAAAKFLESLIALEAPESSS